VLYLGLPVIGVSSPGNTAYFSSTSFTATASQTTFTPSGSYQVGFINVIRNGSQLAPADYTATNGTTVVLNNACTAGDIVVIEVYTLTSISNALPLTGGTVTGDSTFNTGVNLAVSSGNVGIGTSSPARRLDVRGGLGMQVNEDGSGTKVISMRSDFAGAGPAINVTTNDPLLFLTNNTERARIDTSGNLLVGRTSNIGTSRFVVESNAATLNPVSISNTNTVAGGDYAIIFYRNGSIVGSIQTTLSATQFVTSSDYRLKHDIQPMTGALAKVAALKPVTHKWNADNSESQGFIAHELQAVVPECVTGEKDAVDTEGNPVYQGIDTSFLVATLTAAIQEQQAMIEELKAKVAALEAK
jgi:hypothetical protein